MDCHEKTSAEQLATQLGLVDLSNTLKSVERYKFVQDRYSNVQYGICQLEGRTVHVSLKHYTEPNLDDRTNVISLHYF